LRSSVLRYVMGARLCVLYRDATRDLTDTSVSSLHEPVAERLHKAHQRIFLLVGEAEPSNELGVHIVGRFRCGPARGALAEVIGSAARQDVPRVIEMRNRLQTPEIAVVPISLDEAGIGPLVDIPQRRDLKAPHITRREPSPARIDG
jgi:hypothetical protein